MGKRKGTNQGARTSRSELAFPLNNHSPKPNMSLYRSREEVATVLLNIVHPNFQFMSALEGRVDDYFVEAQVSQMQEVLHHRSHQAEF